MLDANAIKKSLNYNCNIISLDEVDSTNTYVKETNLNNGDIVVTNNQTKGKGRLGRTWESKDGLAMSVCVIPDAVNDNLPVISLIMGVAVCEAISEMTNLDIRIKWPNDIVINGKKLCGILTEAKTENNKITKIVCGLGINISNANFSDELKDKATSLYIETGKHYDINKFVCSIANKFNDYIKKGVSLPESFKKLCLTLGKEITVVNCDKSYNGAALDIAANGNLIIKTNNGEVKEISSGEVSVRGIYNYI